MGDFSRETSLQPAMDPSEPAATGLPADASGRLPRRSPLPLRVRSDEELVRRLRLGDEDAFRVIHDRYRARLLAYTRHMLRGSRLDAEEALQDVFVRAHAALRGNAREVSLRAWLYRIAHNRCIDELRRPQPPSPESLALLQPPPEDPIVATIRRESLRRLVVDIGRLPEQQRAALLMRELGGMSYEEIAAALAITVGSVKATLTRARMSLTTAAEARGAACHEIRTQLAAAHERGVRFDGLVRRHLHDCDACRAYRRELQATARRLAALGPGALVAKLFGGATLLGGGAGAGAVTSLGGGASVGGGVLGIGTGQLAALAAAGAIGVGLGGIAALDAGSDPASQRRAAPSVATVAESARAVLATSAPYAQTEPRPRRPRTAQRRPRSGTAPGRPRARHAWATMHPSIRHRWLVRMQLARISGFHLVWRGGALEPVGLARAPRDPQARERWVGEATVTWLGSTVEGRRVVERMHHLPRGVTVALDPDGNWSFPIDMPGRSEAARDATGLAALIWLTSTPQGKRVYRQLRARARRHPSSAQPAPSPAATAPAPTPAATTTPPATTATTPAPPATTTQPATTATTPAPSTTQASPPPTTTTGTEAAPAAP